MIDVARYFYLAGSGNEIRNNKASGISIFSSTGHLGNITIKFKVDY